MLKESVKQEICAAGYLVNRSKATITCDVCDKQADFLYFNPQLMRWETKEQDWKEYFKFTGERLFCCGKYSCQARLFKVIILCAVEEAMKFPGFNHYRSRDS